MVAVTLSAPDDWQDHTVMLDYGFSLYESVSLAEANEFRFSLPCLGGTSETVYAVNRDALHMPLPVQHGEIIVSAESNRYLCAPIREGDAVAELVFRCDGDEVARIPLYAESAVDAIPPKNSPADRLKDLLRIS